MPDDDQSGHDDEEPVLPEEDQLEERRRQQPRAYLPERAKTSPLLRRVVVGGKGEKAKDLKGEDARVKVRFIGGSGRSKGSRSGRSEPESQAELESPRATREAGGTESLAEAEDLRIDEVERESALPESGPTRERGVSGGPAEEPEFERVGGHIRADKLTERRRRRRRKKGGKAFSEEVWSGSGSSFLWWWILAGMVCVGFVAGLFGMRFLRPTAPAVVREENRFTLDDSIKSAPIAGFVENTSELEVQLEDLVKRFEAGEDYGRILRGGMGSAARLKKWRERVPSPAPVHYGQDLTLHAMAINEFGYVVFMGTRQDFSRFGTYFVKEGGAMRLDWEASEGFSEVLPGEVPALTDREPHMMRVLVGGSNYYTDLYPEDRYQCYTMQHRDPENYVWAFAERGSEVDLRLRHRARRADLWGRERRATVKIRRGVEGSRSNQVEVVEVLGADWILPPTDGNTGNGKGAESSD